MSTRTPRNLCGKPNEPAGARCAIPSAKARRHAIAAKQRTSLATEHLIDTLNRDTYEAFTSRSTRADSRTSPPDSRWRLAFTIGGLEDTYGQKHRHIGEMFRSMFYNKLELVDEENWRPVKPLGNGSFGAAGLFKHVNDRGEDDDYVVAKYVQSSQTEMCHKRTPNLSKEALIMMQLNEQESDGILFLRNYRYFKDKRQWLFLTEYCPNFDTEVLRLNYKAMRRYIPETFLWYMLYGFAKGLVAMDQGPFGDYVLPDEKVEGTYVIHRDMKPPNTFLGYAPPPDDPKVTTAAERMSDELEYPHIKIADFGLSEITAATSHNQVKHHRLGSRRWWPPEVRWKEMDANSGWYPFEASCFDAKGDLLDPADRPYNDKWLHSYTPAGNTFVVGYMMYQFLTLDDGVIFSDYINAIMSRDEPEPLRTMVAREDLERLQNWLRVHRKAAGRTRQGSSEATLVKRIQRSQFAEMLHRWDAVPYSHTLTSLVEKCLAFRPEYRISATDLLKEIELAMPRVLARLTMRNAHEFDKETKVFTTEADLNDMTPGSEDLKRDSAFWSHLIRAYEWVDTTAGIIRPDLDDPSIPEEARALFAPGRREEKNKNLVKPGLLSKLEDEAVEQDAPEDSADSADDQVMTEYQDMQVSSLTSQQQAIQRIHDCALASLQKLQSHLRPDLPAAEQQAHQRELQARLASKGYRVLQEDCFLYLEHTDWDIYRAMCAFLFVQYPFHVQNAVDQQAGLILQTYMANHNGQTPAPLHQLQRYVGELRLQIARCFGLFE